jgi:hypothetical protein
VDRTIFALPILPGQAAAARAFLSELEVARNGQYAASERRLGLTKEVWALQLAPPGELYVVYFAGGSIAAPFARFAASHDAFAAWFKGRVRATTGADLKTPPPGPTSAILSDYQA